MQRLPGRPQVGTLPDNRPIGVFDSGVGGLTVLRAIQEHLPAESTIYVGDLARCPYGTRPQEEVKGFAVQIADYLADLDVKTLVVACNTATAAAFDILSTRYSFPVIGVVEPGAREALRISPGRRIGVIATIGTVESAAYRTAIRQIDPSATTIERSASWLVPVVESGALGRGSIEVRLAPTMAEMRDQVIDTLILGCTHFPLVRDIFETEVGPGIVVLDSAETTASEVGRVLARRSIGAHREHPSHRILVTGPAEAFAVRAQAMFRVSPSIEALDLVANYVH
jgi:glutamate racemase